MVNLFWILASFVAYIYIGYPLALHVWSRLRPRCLSAAGPVSVTPSVSIILAARNEGRRLAARIDNLLQLDYPARHREIIVVSDGSTDDTLAVLDRYKSEIECVTIEAGGKARALNAGVERARFGLLVFADARQAFAPDALSALVAPFRDPEVGAVSGELVLAGEARDRRAVKTERRQPFWFSPKSGERRAWRSRREATTSTVVDGVGLYWRYEKQIRRDESAIGSTMGATGAIYAMRRSLWKPLPPDTILDDVLAPMRCVMAGYRVVFEDSARVFDRAARDARSEAMRKRRTLAGNYQLFWLEPGLLLPWRNPAWLQFVSHKVGRLLVPYALPLLLISSLLLNRRSTVYAVAFGGQCVFYLLAAYGAWLERHGPALKGARVTEPARSIERFARVALMFLVMNGSAVTGLVAIATRQKLWR